MRNLTTYVRVPRGASRLAGDIIDEDGERWRTLQVHNQHEGLCAALCETSRKALTVFFEKEFPT